MTADHDGGPVADDRTGELSRRLGQVERRIRDACAAAGRDRDEVTLVVVTKTYPASDVERLAGFGVADFGEARHPEAAHKIDECHAAGFSHLSWHFVGAVQTNKAGPVARYADLVHSVDRLRLVAALDGAAGRAERQLDCLVQLDLDGSGSRGGTGQRSGAPAEIASAVIEAVATARSLRLRGVMAVAPMGADPTAAFERLAAVAAEVSAAHPGADCISAGMSDDLEQAVAAGATHLRVGRAVLGERPPLR
ncbi:MAG: YggS family pyridoxal phosphate-dependent enzyme [Nocardioidaceae bacterium]|nr:YggS family pyridoxal phosphate-dependent enzyme [Nocardioidaceae bacterium]